MNTPLNGVIQLGNTTASISRESDFVDLLKYSATGFLFKVLAELKSICAGFGEVRSPSTDLYRQRLAQLRKHLNAA